jgi:hypothetical protein
MPIVTGKGIKPEKAEKALSKSSQELVAGEEVWFYGKCNNMRPLTDALVVTNSRVMGLSAGVGYKYKARFDEIVDAAYDPSGKTVHITTSKGDAMTFKNVAPEDVAAVQGYVEWGRTQPVPEAIRTALQERSEKDTPPTSPEEEFQRYGRILADDLFGMRTVRIYEKGYVRVSLPLMGSKAKFEKLVAIEASSDVTKKTGLGRGMAAVATGGLNMLSPNKRGDVYLTITTENHAHVLHEDPPTSANLKTAKKLESVGQSVIKSEASGVSSDEVPGPVQRSVADRLRELQQLHDDGLISSEEHQAQRDRLLRDL